MSISSQIRKYLSILSRNSKDLNSLEWRSMTGVPRKQIKNLVAAPFNSQISDFGGLNNLVDYIVLKSDPQISIGIFDRNNLVGAYFLTPSNVLDVIQKNDMTALEDLSKYANKKGIEGIALVVNDSYKDLGLGTQLKNYSKTLGADYIFGLQYKTLGNLQHWLNRRRLVAENKGLYLTLEDLK
jgi:hypothetical protein